MSMCARNGAKAACRLTDASCGVLRCKSASAVGVLIQPLRDAQKHHRPARTTATSIPLSLPFRADRRTTGHPRAKRLRKAGVYQYVRLAEAQPNAQSALVQFRRVRTRQTLIKCRRTSAPRTRCNSWRATFYIMVSECRDLSAPSSELPESLRHLFSQAACTDSVISHGSSRPATKAPVGSM